MNSLYSNLQKETEELVSRGEFDKAHQNLMKFRDDDNEPSLNIARFILYSNQKGNPYYKPEEAIASLDKACDAGETWAIANKAYLLFRGILYPQNVDEADDLFVSISSKSNFAKLHMALIIMSHHRADMKTKEATEEAKGYLLELIESTRCESSVREKAKLKWIEIILDEPHVSSETATRVFMVLSSLKNKNSDLARRLNSEFLLKMMGQQVNILYSSEKEPAGAVEKEQFNLRYQMSLKMLSQLKSFL